MSTSAEVSNAGRGWSWWRRCGVAALTPLALGCAAPGGFAIALLPFALAPWAVVARRGGRAAFLLDYVVGMATQVVWVSWIASVTGLGVGITIVVEGLLFPLVGYALRRPLRAWPLAWALPFAWIGWEYLRGVWPLDGFPWLLLGHAAATWDWMLGVGAVLGVTGATLLCCIAAGALADVLMRAHQARASVALALALWGGAFLYGGWNRAPHDEGAAAADAPLGPAVVVIQPSVPQAVKFEHGALDVFGRNMRLTREALVTAEALLESSLQVGLWGAPWVPSLPPPFEPPHIAARADSAEGTQGSQHFGPDLVGWAETMLLWVRPENEELQGYRRGARAREWEAQDRRVDALFRAGWLCGGELEARGASLLLGQAVAMRNAAGAIEERNAALLFDRAWGYVVGGRYDKRKLVPGGEYLPFLDVIPFGAQIGAAVREAAGYMPDLEPGRHSAALRLSAREGSHAWRVGAAVCLDNAYEDVFREATDIGADWHAVLSNEGWFRGSAEQDHMLAFSAWRATENARAVLRVTNTGVTALFDARGRQVRTLRDAAGSDRDVPGWMWVRIPIAKEQTLYRAGGWWFAPGIASAGALLLLAHLVRSALARCGRSQTAIRARSTEEKTET